MFTLLFPGPRWRRPVPAGGVAWWLAAALLAVSPLGADDVVVLAKGAGFPLRPAVATVTPHAAEHAAFLRAYQGAIEPAAAPFGPARALTPLPDWGRVVAGAGGMIAYHETFAGGFVVRVGLQGLVPNHRYILTLNGNPARAGNGSLVDPVPGNEAERYFDFATIASDEQGAFTGTYGIVLPPGSYELRFYVKDPDDFKIILHRDFFPFVVTPTR